MTLKVQHAGALRTIKNLYVMQAGILRRVKVLKVKDGGSLRTVAIFADPLTVSIAAVGDAVVNGSNVGFTLAATPAGGFSPYTYAWTLQSGSGWTFGSPSSATTSVNGVVGTSSSSPDLRCTVTDSAGQTAHADFSHT